ncbi:MAG: cation:proton antiporter [Pseudanabaenaceae cyanobacterium SKYGB_i_bin29]|nr:cation:proton antiporter [Pseudanabaenaceae cyanobacterium SKYG29]MDW8421302.1 cation:proton antiporter [Pseudanabaenaceae cyanobacterium SKYGB_i_bin29]
MDNAPELTAMMIITIGSGVLAQVIANYLKLPSIVFLLIFGIIAGNDGLGWVRPQDLGTGLEVIVSLSVSLILFEGGLNLKLQDLGRVSGSLRNLVTIGALFTLVGGGVAAHYFSEFPWQLAFLYASLVVVTGPTVINPLLKNIGVDKRLSTLLEGEGVLIDAVGAIVAVAVLNVVLNRDASAIEVVKGLISRLGIGGAIGIVGGYILGEFLKRSQFLADDLKSSVVLAAVLGLAGLAQSIESESGLTTAVLTGIMVRAAAIPDERLLLRFKGQLTLLTISVVFILLSANLSIPSLFALGWGGVYTVLTLMFIIRPVSVLVCTWNSNLNWRQKAFLAWCAPRGIVAASVASLFSLLLTQRGISGGEAVKAQVFLTILMTVFLQGLTASGVAKLLRLKDDPSLSNLVIVGANDLGLFLARICKERGKKVAVIDTNPDSCRRAQENNIPAFVSSGLDVNTLNSAGLDGVGTFIALTVNTDVNLVLAQRALEEFRPSRVFAVYPPQVEEMSDIIPAFGYRVPIKTWNQYINQQECKLGEVVLGKDIDRQLSQFNIFYTANLLLPLMYERNDRLEIVPANITWMEGDRILYLVHRPNLLPNDRRTISTIPDTFDLDAPTIDVQSVTIPRLEGEQDYLNMAREILKRNRNSQ